MLQNRFPKNSLNLNWCIICKVSNEDLDHLLIHCKVANYLWNRLFNLLEIDNIPLTDINSLCNSLCGLSMNSKRNIIIFNYAVVICQTIWIKRNNQTFNEKSSNNINLQNTICVTKGCWTYRSKLFKDYSSSSISLNLVAFM